MRHASFLKSAVLQTCQSSPCRQEFVTEPILHKIKFKKKTHQMAFYVTKRRKEVLKHIIKNAFQRQVFSVFLFHFKINIPTYLLQFCKKIK
jgi:hypothetical protein